jgi:hypothetical protein
LISSNFFFTTSDGRYQRGSGVVKKKKLEDIKGVIRSPKEEVGRYQNYPFDIFQLFLHYFGTEYFIYDKYTIYL